MPCWGQVPSGCHAGVPCWGAMLGSSAMQVPCWGQVCSRRKGTVKGCRARHQAAGAHGEGHARLAPLMRASIGSIAGTCSVGERAGTCLSGSGARSIGAESCPVRANPSDVNIPAIAFLHDALIMAEVCTGHDASAQTTPAQGHIPVRGCWHQRSCQRLCASDLAAPGAEHRGVHELGQAHPDR